MKTIRGLLCNLTCSWQSLQIKLVTHWAGCENDQNESNDFDAIVPLAYVPSTSFTSCKLRIVIMMMIWINDTQSFKISKIHSLLHRSISISNFDICEYHGESLSFIIYLYYISTREIKYIIQYTDIIISNYIFVSTFITWRCVDYQFIPAKFIWVISK